MTVCYNKLWKKLIDINMTKTELCKQAKISTNAMAKLGRDESVKVDILVRICNALGCKSIDEIMEITSDS